MIWREVTNKRNLEATIQRCLRDGDTDLQISRNEIESDEEPEKKKRNWKRILAWLFIILCIIVLIIMTVIHSTQSSRIAALNELEDTRLIAYEGQIPTVKSIALLFAIGDEESYQRARSGISMTSDLRAIYFVNDHYRGTEDTSISVSIQNILYEITEGSSVKYLVYLTRSTNTESKQYLVETEYVGTTLIGLRVLN